MCARYVTANARSGSAACGALAAWLSATVACAAREHGSGSAVRACMRASTPPRTTVSRAGAQRAAAERGAALASRSVALRSAMDAAMLAAESDEFARCVCA